MPKQPHKHPLLPNYTFPLSILLLCLLPPLISTSPALANPQIAFIPPTPIGDRRTLNLKHIYHRGSSGGPFSSLFRRLDFTPSQLATQHRLSPHEETSYAIGIQFGSTFKPPVGYTQDMRRARTNGEMSSLCRTMGAYEEGYGLVPDTTDNETIVGLAKMSYNAYNDANKRDDWYDLGEKWGVNVSFGWETNGLRGHIFGDDENTTLILAIKGTSAGIFGGGDTGSNDKLNDNLLWSCCCARVDRTWQPVCGCYMGDDYKCNGTCVEESLAGEELYYAVAMQIYFEVADAYPNAEIWLTGHSLGGSLASLLGLTFGLPTVTFEDPGDRLAARRLHLPGPPALNYAKIPMWHIGNTADPIFMGVCTGPLSSCWYGGFAVESRCHTGRTCIYDVVNQSGWKMDIRSHRIGDVIEKILTKWEGVPDCFEEQQCDDCDMWEFEKLQRKSGCPA